MADPLSQRTDPVYQKDGQKCTHTTTLTWLQQLSLLPESTQGLFKPPPESNTPYILTTPSTIFHAQGGGQPSDTGNMTLGEDMFAVHQVRKVDPAILHMGSFRSAEAEEAFTARRKDGAEGGEVKLCQSIDVQKRLLHSRIHTAGHVIGLAIHQLISAGTLPSNITDGKASHYPSAAFVEFSGLIPGDAKAAIQQKVDDMVAQNLPVSILFWDEDTAKKECMGVGEGVKGDEVDGVRVVRIGDVGSYPCGGTHVLKLSECGRVLVRGVKRQKGVSKVSYEVQDAS